MLSLPVHPSAAQLITWSIVALGILGIVTRPAKLPEAVWAAAGAIALVALGLIPLNDVLAAAARGTDVYLFLVGMMLLAELGRREGLFEWLAAYALRHAQGSARRLFLLVYAVGTLVTVFLSNDATAVVLTPAVCASARRAQVPALPYLFACAFIANAASFVLPISNPANLVVFGEQMPLLGSWLAGFGLASLASVVVTYLVLRLTLRRSLTAPLAPPTAAPPLSLPGRIAAGTIVLSALGLLLAAACGWPLGPMEFVLGAAACGLICLIERRSPVPLLGHIAWSVLPLVAGLFVLVQATENTGALAPLVNWLSRYGAVAPRETAALSAGSVALASNAINNLPMGLVAATVARSAHASAQLLGAILIGVDLGPNLSITGSLATILWLIAIRREGEHVGFLGFLGIGVWVMPASLVAALLTFLFGGLTS